MNTDDRPSTQTRHPWRATLRTAFAVVVGLVPVLPEVADTLGIEQVPVVLPILAVAAAVTRVLAIPAVDRVLKKYLPPLASAPRTP